MTDERTHQDGDKSDDEDVSIDMASCDGDQAVEVDLPEVVAVNTPTILKSMEEAKGG